MTIDLNTATNIILVRQRWAYEWISSPRITLWTLRERRAYHSRLEAAILRSWNNRAVIRVTGTSPFAKSMAHVSLSVRIDVQWVLRNPHWSVTVKKIPIGDFDTSKVNWGQRRIWLDSNDITVRRFATEGIATEQWPTAHEFGHAFGNVPQRGHGDEYREESIYRKDVQSILNVGNALRTRHFDHLISEMNVMVPDTRFQIGSVR